MRAIRFLFLTAVIASFAACGGGAGHANGTAQCDDGKDNDGDGKIDFPDDPGCTSAEDDTENSPAAAQCMDGRDNDGDGKVDFPDDPGCFAPNQDDETDDCPDGPGCPQCSNGKDDDDNGATDYPGDIGCTSASDNDEYTENPIACGQGITIKPLPADGHIPNGMLTSATSKLNSMTCGGPGAEDVYELRVQHPKVIVATTDMGATSADTVLYIRSAMCSQATSEVACNDDISTGDTNSKVVYSASEPGTYYLVVDTKSSIGGSYDLTVQFLVGEGESCTAGDDCGPGLVCRVPLGGTDKVCSKHVCQDGVDDDGDGKADYPDDPGCADPTDDDETDDCPSGPNCPECANGSDDDSDGKIDYPMDTQCHAASSTSEACVSHESVAALTTPVTMGDTSTATDDVMASCAYSAGAPDLTYRLDLPALDTFDIAFDSGSSFWYPSLELFNSTCAGTGLVCDSYDVAKTNVAAGTYYLLVDGDDSTESGPFTLTVTGKIKNGGSCESALAQSGALSCNTGYACKGATGARTCQKAKCSNGSDDDGDGKADYPFDPGCADPGDDDEGDPATPPVCSDGMDNDTDTKTDFPADFGCTSAADTSEAFCSLEVDTPTLITTKTTMGTTVGKADDYTATCASSSAPEVTYGLELPVPVTTLVIDTTGFDTILSVLDTHCATTLACNDESPNNTTVGPSEITMNNVLPGGYAIQVDGYLSASNAFTLTVHGVAAVGATCNTPLFSGGANAVLSCPASCNATTHKCQ